MTPDFKPLEDYFQRINTPKKEWISLTEDEIKKASLEARMQEHYMGFHSGFTRFYQALEEKLKEKNL